MPVNSTALLSKANNVKKITMGNTSGGNAKKSITVV